jgi:hypothetical protein
MTLRFIRVPGLMKGETMLRLCPPCKKRGHFSMLIGKKLCGGRWHWS